MRIITKQFPPAEEYKLSFLGDWHLGTAACDESYIQSSIAKIAEEPNHYIIGMGDYGDFIHTRDKRYNEDVISRELLAADNLFTWQVEKITGFFEPVRDRVLCLLTGNHELTGKKFYYTNPVDVVSYNLEVPHLGYSGFVRLKFTEHTMRRVITVFVHHGYGAGRTSGAKINKVHAFAQDYDADIYAMGHVHEVHSSTKPILGVSRNGKRLVAKNKHFLITGSALKAHLPDRLDSSGTTYVEQAAFPPVAIGHVEVSIRPFAGKYNEPEIRATEVLG